MKIILAVCRLLPISLLQFAKFYLYIFVPFIFIIFLFGCSVTHQHGELPKVKINTEIADDVELKIRKDEVSVEFEWEL